MRKLLYVAWLAAPAAFAQDPVGPAFRVNVETGGEQRRPAVAMSGDGGFVVAWVDGPGNEVRARRFDRSGAALGATFVVAGGPAAVAYPRPLSAAAAASGHFLVTWDAAAGGGGQVCDADGTPAGDPLALAGRQPSAAAAGADAFVVAWATPDGDATGVVANRFGASGEALGPAFTVNAWTTSAQTYPVAAGRPAGDFVIAWTQMSGSAPPLDDVFVQRFDTAASPTAGNVAVNAFTTGYQRRPAVAMDLLGNTVVVWEEDTIGLDPSHSELADIWAQRFDATGAPVGGNFRVNSHTPGFQRYPAVAFDDSGSFLVAWEGNSDIWARRFDVAGLPAGTDFLVHSATTGRQYAPSVAGTGAGQFVVVWQDSIFDGGPSAPDVWAQVFRDDNLIFADDFESGDHSAWSASATAAGPLEVVPLQISGRGTWALRTSVSAPGGTYVQDDSPDGEVEYHARFYLDARGFDPGEAEAHFRTRAFIGFQASPARRVFALVLRRKAGAYGLMARATLEDGSRVETAFVPLSPQPHAIEVAYTRASTSTAADGSLALWLDGVAVATLSGLDNHATAIDFVRMGALSAKTGAAGVLDWDDFVSQRAGLIGP